MRHVTDHAAEGQDRPARSYRVEALAKGLRLLSYFTAERPALHVKDLVELSGIPMPTVFRLVATLTEEGYLERTVDGMVRPGTGVLAPRVSPPCRAARPGADYRSRCCVTWRPRPARRSTSGSLYGDQVPVRGAHTPPRHAGGREPSRRLETVPAVFSLHRQDDPRLPQRPTSSAQRVTADSFRGTWGPQAVTTVDALSAQLELARQDGYLVQRDEAIPGLSSIAAPIRQAGDTVAAAVNVAVPSAEYANERLVDRLLEPLLGASREISRRMGGTAPRVHGQYRRVLK